MFILLREVVQMANINISGFSIDEGINLTFDTGGAVPPPAPETDNLGKPVNCMINAVSAGTPICGNLEIIPVEAS